MTVPFLDLGRQYETIKDDIDRVMHEVVTKGQFILGPHVKAFEAEFADYCRARHAVGVASGTDAIRLALEALAIGPGAEVITSTFTFMPTAEMISPSSRTRPRRSAPSTTGNARVASATSDASASSRRRISAPSAMRAWSRP